MKKELIEVLHIFQQGYVERDCNKNNGVWKYCINLYTWYCKIFF